MKKILSLFRLTLKLVSWIHQVFKLSESRPIRDYETLVNCLIRVGKTRGQPFLIEYIKKVRLSLLHHLSGEYKEKIVCGISVTSDGIPKVLGALIASVRRRQSPILQIVTTLLFATRALNLGTVVDTSPITDPSKEAFPLDGKYVRSFWKGLGYRSTGISVPRSVRFKSYHFTTKSGPNGHALWNCLSDLYCLPIILLNNILLMGGPKLQSHVTHLMKMKWLLETLLPAKGKSFRKLSWFPDKENKVRVIAIGDYWSQTVLFPLHSYLFRVLRKIPQDCTFNQALFTEKVKDWKFFYSIDLSNATDRFPISAISTVLSGHFPQWYINA
jgi:hypothetical protein